MSVRVMALVWQLALKPHQKLALLAIADHANDEGVAWPGQQSLARKVGVKERQLRTTLGELQVLGYLRIERPHVGASNLYWVMPTTGSAVPVPRQWGAKSTGSGVPVKHKVNKMNQAAQLPMTYEQRPNSPEDCSHRALDDTGYCSGCRTQL